MKCARELKVNIGVCIYCIYKLEKTISVSDEAENPNTRSKEDGRAGSGRLYVCDEQNGTK